MTVRQSNRTSRWNTSPVPEAGARMGSPSSNSLPLVGISRPATMRSRVLFPQPLGPTSETKSPFGTEKSMSLSA